MHISSLKGETITSSSYFYLIIFQLHIFNQFRYNPAEFLYLKGI